MILRQALNQTRTEQARERSEGEACEALARAVDRYSMVRSDDQPEGCETFDFCIGHDYLSEMIGNR